MPKPQVSEAEYRDLLRLRDKIDPVVSHKYLKKGSSERELKKLYSVHQPPLQIHFNLLISAGNSKN